MKGVARILLCDLSSEVCIDKKPFHTEGALQPAFLLGLFPFHSLFCALMRILSSSRLLDRISSSTTACLCRAEYSYGNRLWMFDGSNASADSLELVRRGSSIRHATSCERRYRITPSGSTLSACGSRRGKDARRCQRHWPCRRKSSLSSRLEPCRTCSWSCQ